jgi:hypothetical protein
MSEKERAALGYLSGEALEKAKGEARWIDPAICDDRINLAGKPAGSHCKPWVPHTTRPQGVSVNRDDMVKRAASTKKGHVASAEKRRAA